MTTAPKRIARSAGVLFLLPGVVAPAGGDPSQHRATRAPAPGRARTAGAARAIRAAGAGRVDLFVADLSSQAELQLPAASVTAHALHPGVVRTAFGAEDPSGVQRLLIPFLRPFLKSPAQGAA